MNSINNKHIPVTINSNREWTCNEAGSTEQFKERIDIIYSAIFSGQLRISPALQTIRVSKIKQGLRSFFFLIFKTLKHITQPSPTEHDLSEILRIYCKYLQTNRQYIGASEEILTKCYQIKNKMMDKMKQANSVISGFESYHQDKIDYQWNLVDAKFSKLPVEIMEQSAPAYPIKNLAPEI